MEQCCYPLGSIGSQFFAIQLEGMDAISFGHLAYKSQDL